jgi:transposase
MSSVARVTIGPESPDASKRRRYSIAEKRRIVEQALVPGASVARVAREHGVNSNLVFGWRRQYQRGLLGGNVPPTALVPVTVSEAPPVPEPAPASPGILQLQLPKGRLRIEGAVDPASLRVVLECLLE